MAFHFLDTRYLADGTLRLQLFETTLGSPGSGLVPAYNFHICNAKSGMPMGTIALRVGCNENIHYGGNIGYEVYPAYRGNRYAGRACQLLLPLARAHGMGELLITCNPDNLPSRRTIEGLGARLLTIVDIPKHMDMYRMGERQKCIYEWNITPYFEDGA